MIILRSLYAVIPPPSRDHGIKSTLETLRAVDESERSIKFLLKNEFLHEFGLLHSSRSIIATEFPPTPHLQTDPQAAPASAEETLPKGATVETPLIKCSGSLDGAGSASKPALPPVIEEEGIVHREGKEATEAILKEPITEEYIVDLGQAAGHEGDDASIYEGLSDIMITSSELFRDVVTVSKPTSPIAGASLNIPPTPATQEMTSAVQASITPVSQSGSWRVVYTTHTLRIFWLYALFGILTLVQLLPLMRISDTRFLLSQVLLWGEVIMMTFAAMGIAMTRGVIFQLPEKPLKKGTLEKLGRSANTKRREPMSATPAGIMIAVTMTPIRESLIKGGVTKAGLLIKSPRPMTKHPLALKFHCNLLKWT